jgi:hypothetical protein
MMNRRRFLLTWLPAWRTLDLPRTFQWTLPRSHATVGGPEPRPARGECA